jgi:hypothetical protein
VTAVGVLRVVGEKWRCVEGWKVGRRQSTSVVLCPARFSVSCCWVVLCPARFSVSCCWVVLFLPSTFLTRRRGSAVPDRSAPEQRR